MMATEPPRGVMDQTLHLTEERTYHVREAVLVKTEAGSAWTVRFSAIDDSDDDVIVAIAPEKLDGMTFARPYRLDEIRALAEVHVVLADPPSPPDVA
jgi:hypothetical protein